MLDFDLAELYQVSTSALNQSVKRNAKRFPPDFMFQITQEEFDSLKSQIVTSSWGGTRKLPNAFTEQGLAMLSGVLNSDTAIDMNIRVMRAFVSMRAFLLNGNIAAELNQLHCRVKKLERTSDETLEAINDLSDMGVLTPRPSIVRANFEERYESEGPQAATDWFYKFSQDTDYIRRVRLPAF